MATRSVRIDESVYERIEAHKLEGETFSEAIERLIGGCSLLDFAGELSEAEADELRETIDDANERYTGDLGEELGL
ncbi:hypothetical protein BRD16_02320 [Halobacteriales archaeon SW_6_65_46]|nr:MAG: hypothetical protein BRD16_02320 [Halobacteriales archaeon SW_6_65_46]